MLQIEENDSNSLREMMEKENCFLKPHVTANENQNLAKVKSKLSCYSLHAPRHLTSEKQGLGSMMG